MTPAIRALRAAGAAFVPHFYKYVDRGGTQHAAESLQVDEHAVIKTLVMEAHQDGGKKLAVLVLMHGDREVSTKQLARLLHVKTVAPASEAAVTKHTGYLPGGVSPFGTRTALPVYIEESVLSLEQLFINGGKRGFLVAVAPSEVQRMLPVVPINVAVSETHP